MPWVGVEFYESQFSFHRAAALTEVHSTFIIAKDAYGGMIDLAGIGARNIYHEPGSGGTLRPAQPALDAGVEGEPRG